MEIQCRNNAVLLDLYGTGTFQREDLEDLQPVSFTFKPESLNTYTNIMKSGASDIFK